MSLSSLIVQREVATMRQVEEALARQVIYGGDLVTNLLEVARVDEPLLTRLLAESMRLPAAPAGALPEVPARVRALLSPEFAAQHAAIPLELMGEKRLTVVVAGPLPPDVERQLSLTLGMTIEQRAAPLVRVQQAIAREYGVPLDRRMERLVSRMSGDGSRGALGAYYTPGPLGVSYTPGPPGASSMTPGPPRSVPVESAPGRTGTPAFGTVFEVGPTVSDRLMPVPLVRRKTSASFPAARLPNEALPPMAPASVVPGIIVPPPSVAPPPAVAPAAPFVPPPDERPLASEPAYALAPAPASEPTRASPTPRPPSLVPAVSDRPSLIKRATIPSLRAGPRHRGPLPSGDARRLAEEALDRDTLLDLFFEFSRQFFDYAAIFLLHGDIAEGRDAFGDGAHRDRVLGIGIPLDMPSMLSEVREMGSPQVIKVRPDGLDASLLIDLGRSRDVEVAVVPLVVRTRVVAILVGDCGEASVDGDSLSEVAAFAGAVGAAFERIIVRRKLEGFVPGDAEAAVGRVTGLLASKRAASIAPKNTQRPGVPSIAAGAPALVAALASSRPSSRPSPPARASGPAPGTAVESPHTIDTVRPPSRRPESLSALPPPPINAVFVRKLSGPPIPREEPPSSVPAAAVGRVTTRPPPGRVTRAPSGSISPPVEEVRVLSDADAAQALFTELGWVTKDAPVKGFPSSSGAVNVPARRPPTSMAPAIPEALPTVIVETDGEVRTLVERVVAAGATSPGEPTDLVDTDTLEDADLAAADLLRRGAAAVTTIMAQFPGPVAYAPARIAAMSNPPRPSECGPLLNVVVRLRRAALPALLHVLGHADADVRAWAVYVFSEAPQIEAVGPIVARLGDVDPSVAGCAMLALKAAARAMPDPTREALAALGQAVVPADRQAAVRALGQLRDPATVPQIVTALGDDDDRVVQTAHRALVEITRQDFGGDARLWIRWWETNASRHRIEWLIDALTHDAAEVRRAAGDELRAVTREYFGYTSDLPQRDRERAQQRYRDWWSVEGKARFRTGVGRA
jgi:hypothetical protein